MLHMQQLAAVRVWLSLVAVAPPRLSRVRCGQRPVGPLPELPWPVLHGFFLAVCLPAKLHTGPGRRKAWRQDAPVLCASCRRVLLRLRGGWPRGGRHSVAHLRIQAPGSAWRRSTFRRVVPIRPSSAQFHLVPLPRYVRRRCV